MKAFLKVLGGFFKTLAEARAATAATRLGRYEEAKQIMGNKKS